MLTTISAIGGLVGLMVSVLLLSLQTRAVVKQTKISNAIAGMSALRESTEDLRETFSVFLSCALISMILSRVRFVVGIVREY